MTDRPIIFSGPMIRLFLAGRKTQTRRLAWKARGGCFVHKGMKPPAVPTIWQRVQPGDRLWVRETWAIDAPLDQVRREVEDAIPPALGHGPYYRADDIYWDSGFLRWRSPIYMPRWASRLTLTVTHVRLERLEEITEEDAKAEGVIDTGWRDGEPYPHCIVPGVSGTMEHDARTTFLLFWDKLHGDGSWRGNPEVVVITFKCCANETGA